MNCRDNESLILAERDGALTNPQLAALSDHVATCPTCRKLRADLATALTAYHTGAAAVTVPDADEAWRDLQGRLNQPTRKPRLAPVIWFATPLAAAAALAFAFLPISQPHPSAPELKVAIALPAPPLHDPSFIAGADFVEAGDPDASTLVYVDKESGWLVVWATAADTDTRG